MTAEAIHIDHGPHWSALGIRDVGAFLNARIGAMLKPGGAVGMVHDGRCHMVEKGGRLRVSAMLQRTEKGLLVLGVYPYTESAYLWPLRVAQMQHTEDRSQGRLLGDVNGAAVAVFDTMFWKGVDRYRVGEIVEVQASAIALRFGAETLREPFASDFVGFAPVALTQKTSGFAPDEIEAHSVVTAAEEVEFHDHALMRYEVALARMPNFTMKVDVFVAPAVCSRRFAVGERVGGALWLFAMAPEPALLAGARRV